MLAAIDSPAAPAAPPAVKVRTLGITPYADTLERMRAFTRARDAASADEIWLTEHEPVYTQGLAGRPEHVLDAHGIPVIATDRGGQVTYHGPGQVLAYILVDLARRDLKVRELVRGIEGAAIATLGACGIAAARQAGRPGVYVDGAKIAALGLKVTRGCCYHGVSLNVDNDLAPFAGINPCGHAGLASASLASLGLACDRAQVAARLAAELKEFIESRE